MKRKQIIIVTGMVLVMVLIPILAIHLKDDIAREKVYTGELLGFSRENETDFVDVKIENGNEIRFAFTEKTRDESPTRNFIRGQTIEIRCKEQRNSDYRPIISIRIKD